MLKTVLVAALAGVGGTLLGGILATVTPRRAVPYLSAASGGIMLAVVALDLLPEATALTDFRVVALAFAAGVLLLIALRSALDKDGKDDTIITKGKLLLLAIALHNLPEGLAIGAGASLESGATVALLIALHNVPEGVAVAAPLIEGGTTRFKAALAAGASGLPTLVGGVLGVTLASVFSGWIAVSLALAAGAMTSVAFCELHTFPTLNDRQCGFAQTVGFLLAFVLINLL